MTVPGSPAPPARRPHPGQPTAHDDHGEPMPPLSSHDPVTALNEVRSEVVDLALTARQAQHTVREGHELRAELDRVFTSAPAWAALLVDADNARRGGRPASGPVKRAITGCATRWTSS